MKQEEFYQIMDCASEQDITEMMQYHRSRRFSRRKENITMTEQMMTGSKPIVRHRHRGYAAAAVAAFLLALNLGGGFLLLHMRGQRSAEEVQSIACPAESGTASESTEQLTEPDTETAFSEADPAESASEAITPREDLPQYVQLMQLYYEGQTQEPCHYDFTGLGKDLDASYENDRYQITLRAVAGCEWILYYFYDVAPKNGTTWEDFWSDTHVSMSMWNEGDPDYMTDAATGYSCPAPCGTDITEPDHGVWHVCGKVYNQTGVPFSVGKSDSTPVTFSVKIGVDEIYPVLETELDFADTAFPLTAAEKPAYLSRFAEPDFVYGSNTAEWLAEWQAHPMTRSAVTPFGVFYTADPFTAAENDFVGSSTYFLGENEQPAILSYTGYVQKNADGAIVDSFRFAADSYCSTYHPDETGENSSATMFVLFDHPADLTKGEITSANGE